MVSLKNIKFSYINGEGIFRGLNLEMEPGRVYGLLGPNGAGKTTLLKMISAQLKPESGDCFVCGFNSKSREVQMLKSFFFVPDVFLFPKMRVRAFVDYYACFYPDFDEVYFYTRLKEFGFEEKQKLSTLSLGERKKILILFALSTQVPLLLMDEPLSGLDVFSRKKMKKLLIDSMSDERIIVISTNQVAEVELLIDNVIMMNKGGVLFNASLNKLVDLFSVVHVNDDEDDQKPIYTERLYGSNKMLLVKQEGDLSDHIDLEFLFDAAVYNPQGIVQVLNQD